MQRVKKELWATHRLKCAQHFKGLFYAGQRIRCKGLLCLGPAGSNLIPGDFNFNLLGIDLYSGLNCSRSPRTRQAKQFTFLDISWDTILVLVVLKHTQIVVDGGLFVQRLACACPAQF